MSARPIFHYESDRLEQGDGTAYECFTVSTAGVGIVDSFDTRREARAYALALNTGRERPPAWVTDYLAKSPGQRAYEADCAWRPKYHDGTARTPWAGLSDIARQSWERNPTARH